MLTHKDTFNNDQLASYWPANFTGNYSFRGTSCYSFIIPKKRKSLKFADFKTNQSKLIK